MGPVGRADEVEEFAESLRALKERSGRSYGALATRLHVSTSTLHRYCNGDAVPTDYAPVERFARLCGATPEELIALHRRWMLADAHRTARAARAADRDDAAGGTARERFAARARLRAVSADAASGDVASDGAASGGAASGGAASGGTESNAARAAWRTRPWALVAGAAAVLVLAVTAVEVRSSGGGGAP
ncbi:helix-turn-helix domain-containing protein, partial [Streptomyces botrytidirepellens]|uniref:helix-turn-helix domain-containing protein n=1 Tax=Streptomyces botrytidirepellens TaxID=2486417 RepID=UPI003CCC6EF1